MAHWLRPFRVVAAIALVLSLVCQGTWVLAGTTGTLSGTVTDSATHQPLAGAKVTATSPSQSASVTTDGAGHFAFLALAPDTYTVAVVFAGYDQSVANGVTVIADSTRVLNVTSNKTLQTIGKVTSRAATDLVKPGTTADVYSINAVQQDKSAGLGGGGNLNSAWSALAGVPGVFVNPGQSGYIGASPTLSIRGGDYDQIGYELDGVPVNRAFDQYPSGTVSSLGQQELQVYTGAAPANAEAEGISGFINQVIKTGTYPSSSTITGDIGGPAYYHKFSIETGGATADRNFSYYIGLGGYNQDFRYLDQYNGASVSQLYGIPLAPCSPTLSAAVAPSCYTAGLYNGNTGADPIFGAGAGSFVLGGENLFWQSSVADRDNVVNLHFGLPHKNGTKDDIQLLASINSLGTQFYDSTNDFGGAAHAATILGGVPSYLNGYQYNGPTGVALPGNYQALTSVYNYPQSGPQTGGSTIPVDLRDSQANNQGIFKLQYTHALGANALLKLYGYTYYSNWTQYGPQSTFANFFGPASPDYELSSHTRGLSGTFTDQLGSNNLLSFQGSYTTANTLRDNNTQMLNFGSDGYRAAFAALVSSANPLSGVCYLPGGAPTTCAVETPAGTGFANPAIVTIAQAAAGAIPAATGTCGTGACQYLVVGNGEAATYNTVKPQFTSLSLTDQYKPTSKLTVDAGIRLDRIGFQLADTTQGAAREFFYNAFNLDNCIATSGGALIARAPGAACPAGSSPANITNPSGAPNIAFNEYQPRIGFTYSLDPVTVVRASYGRFAQAPDTAYEQYDTLQANAPAVLYNVYGFQKYGFIQPDHTVVPQTSDNLDFSLEHQFGHDTSIKLSPFLRKTQNQIQLFFLNQQTSFVSGLNVGNQTSQGLEFEVDKGNFARDGLAAKLSLAYNNSYIRYTALPNGSSVIDPLNAGIKSYNAYTSFCAKNPTAAPCAGAVTSSGAAAAPCYTTGGAADFACGAASIANPYWNAPVQGLLDPNGSYPTFDTFPGAIGSSVNGYGAPYTATFLLQYKRHKLAITPAVQLFAGQRYGAPATTYGIAPDTCTAGLGGVAGDPRYPYGAPGGSSFNYSSCGQLPAGIPDPYTGKFDTIGAFAQPTQLTLHTQISYDITPRVSLVVNLANIYNTCFGGSKTGFTVPGSCYYGVVADGFSGDVGNLYNPGSAIQPYVNTPYEPFVGSSSSGSTGLFKLPFSVYVSARVKL